MTANYNASGCICRTGPARLADLVESALERQRRRWRSLWTACAGRCAAPEARHRAARLRVAHGLAGGEGTARVVRALRGPIRPRRTPMEPPSRPAGRASRTRPWPWRWAGRRGCHPGSASLPCRGRSRRCVRGPVRSGVRGCRGVRWRGRAKQCPAQGPAGWCWPC